MTSPEVPIDFLIITALEEERKAVVARLPDCQELPPEGRDIRRYFYSRLPFVRDGQEAGTYRVVVVQLLGMGRVQAATATGDAIRRWRPRYVVMVGIAGGVKAKGVGLGDILVSQQVVDYELQKLTTAGPQIRWEVHQVDPRLLAAAQHLEPEACLSLVTARRPRSGSPARRIGPVASGDKVIAYGAALRAYRDHWSALLGVEMEAAGVATAAFQASKAPGFLMVRGVSDLADENKDSKQVGNWRTYACEVAAAYTVALLRSGPIPLTGGGRQRANASGGRASGKAAANEARRSYLTHLRRQCLALPLTALGDDDDRETVLTLDDVYIDLETTTQVPVAPGRGRKAKPGPRLGDAEGRESRALSAWDAALLHERLVLLGAPGAGKSTFVQRLLARVATRQLGESSELDTKFPKDLLPALVILRDLAPRLANLQPDQWSEEERREKLSALVRDLAVENLARLHAAEFAQELTAAFDSGRLLLVLDGLDEVPHSLQRTFRQTVGAVLTRFRPERVIVTCRVRSYEGEARLGQFEAHTLAPFTQEQIGRFVKGWYEAQHRHGRIDAQQAREKAADLEQAALSAELRELAENPMLLTTMALIHQRETKLPTQRVQLYALAVDVLVRRWQKGKTGRIADFLNDPLHVRAVLERLAFEAHQTGRGESALADLSRGTALEILELPEYLGSAARASEFLDYVDQRAGLLVGRGGEPGRPQVYSFPHRTFQEYLAGCHLLSGRNPGAVGRAFLERAGEGQNWGLAARLAFEELAHNTRGGRNQLLDLAYHLCPCQPSESIQDRRADLWSGFIASLLGTEVIRRDGGARDGGPRYLERLVPRLVALLGADLPALERAEAGRVLAVLGDPRPGVGVGPNGLPDIEWIKIDAGPFIMGTNESGKSFLDNRPRFECRLIDRPYQVSRYPVTVAQFDVFVREGGYAEPRFWPEAGWRWRKKGNVQRPKDYREAFQTPNHPRVGVSWFEALAFCRWLSERTGKEIRLPSEAEWERAARHTDGREYPWGPAEPSDKLCNWARSRIGATSAVGLFPEGNPPSGAGDMAGNVWEWCRTKPTADYHDYAAKAGDRLEGDELRLLRGGSWVSGDPTALSCSCRHYDLPDGRLGNFGFRCVWLEGTAR